MRTVIMGFVAAVATFVAAIRIIQWHGANQPPSPQRTLDSNTLERKSLFHLELVSDQPDLVRWGRANELKKLGWLPDWVTPVHMDSPTTLLAALRFKAAKQPEGITATIG